MFANTNTILFGGAGKILLIILEPRIAKGFATELGDFKIIVLLGVYYRRKMFFRIV